MIKLCLIIGIKIMSILICGGLLYLVDNSDDIRELYSILNKGEL